MNETPQVVYANFSEVTVETVQAAFKAAGIEARVGELEEAEVGYIIAPVGEATESVLARFFDHLSNIKRPAAAFVPSADAAEKFASLSL